MITKILLLDKIPDKGIEVLKTFAEVVDGSSYNPKEILREISKYNGVIVSSGNIINQEFLDSAKNLRFIGRAGSGLDNINVELVCKRKIELITSPEGNACSAAEYTLCMMILLSHKLIEAHNNSKKNNFQRYLCQGRNIKELTVGIVGLGYIGTEIVKMISPLVKKVIGYSPRLKNNFHEYKNFEYVNNLDSLLYRSDIVSLNCSLNKDTEYLFNETTFSKIKKGCILINTSRGKVIDDKALLKAFDQGIISFAALDTLFTDPNYNLSLNESMYSHFLINHPNVFYTPHIAVYTKDAQEEVAINLSNKIKKFLSM